MKNNFLRRTGRRLRRGAGRLVSVIFFVTQVALGVALGLLLFAVVLSFLTT